MLINRNQTKENFRSRTVSQTVSFGPLTLRFITIVIVAILCILYLAQSTHGATQNYEVRELEQKQQDIEKENERLEVEALRLEALKNIDEDKNKKIDEKKYEVTENIEYVE
jgi:cell division protein FtsL